MAPLLAEVIRAVYLNQSVSPCYNLITPEVQAKKKEEVEKIMKEKEAKKLSVKWYVLSDQDGIKEAMEKEELARRSEVLKRGLPRGNVLGARFVVGLSLIHISEPTRPY